MAGTTNRSVTDGETTASRLVLVALTMAVAAVASVDGAIPTGLSRLAG